MFNDLFNNWLIQGLTIEFLIYVIKFLCKPSKLKNENIKIIDLKFRIYDSAFFMIIGFIDLLVSPIALIQKEYFLFVICLIFPIVFIISFVKEVNYVFDILQKNAFRKKVKCKPKNNSK